jgi:hypothetical protein
MRKWLLPVVLVCSVLPLQAQIQRTYQYGVVPTENITTLEANPKLTVIDDSAGISMSEVTFKTYRVIDDSYNWGVEVPFMRYESRMKSETGLGDVLIGGTWVHPERSAGEWGYGAKMEVFLPTATDRLLGTGTLQASPSLFGLWAVTEDVFVALGYKHYVSLLKDHARDSIDMGRIRFNAAYTSQGRWWVLTNIYYYMDYRNGGRQELQPEIEGGTLINEGTAVYLKMATHAAGNWHTQDWSTGIGFKVLYL